MNKKQIKPARDGLLVRKPDGTHLAADGEMLAVSAYWLRRETCGDVVISDVTVNEKTVKTTKTTKTKRKSS